MNGNYLRKIRTYVCLPVYVVKLSVMRFGSNLRRINHKQRADIWVMTCRRDVFRCLGLIVTLKCFVGDVVVRVNHDGSLDRWGVVLIKLFGGSVDVVSSSQQRDVRNFVADYKLVSKFLHYWQGKKIIIPMVIGKSERILLLDSDIFFVKDPEEIKRFIFDAECKEIYASDFLCYQLMSKVEWREEVGVDIKRKKLNASIIGLRRKRVDFKFIEKILQAVKNLENQRVVDYFSIDQTVMYGLMLRSGKTRELKLADYVYWVGQKEKLSDPISVHFPGERKGDYYYMFVRLVSIW